MKSIKCDTAEEIKEIFKDISMKYGPIFHNIKLKKEISKKRKKFTPKNIL